MMIGQQLLAAGALASSALAGAPCAALEQEPDSITIEFRYFSLGLGPESFDVIVHEGAEEAFASRSIALAMQKLGHEFEYSEDLGVPLSQNELHTSDLEELDAVTLSEYAEQYPDTELAKQYTRRLWGIEHKIRYQVKDEEFLITYQVNLYSKGRESPNWHAFTGDYSIEFFRARATAAIREAFKQVSRR